MGLAFWKRHVCVSDVVALYLRHAELHATHSPDHGKQVCRLLGLFCKEFGSTGVHSLRAHHLVDWVAAHAEWSTAWTRRNNAAVVKAAFQWAADQERIHKNPFARVRLPSGDRAPAVTDDLLAKVFAASNKSLERLLRFLRLTGCRVSEACAAEWSDMDLGRGVWRVTKHKTRRRTRKPKFKALVPAAITLLLSFGPAEGPVFKNTLGRPWTRKAAHLALITTCRRIGVKTTLHAIRHRFGSAWVANGGSLKLLAEQLGHSTTRTTEEFYVDLGDQIDCVRAEAQRVLG